MKQRFIITAKSDARTSDRLQPQGTGLSFIGSIKTRWVENDNNGKGFTRKQAEDFIAKNDAPEGVSYAILATLR